MHFWIHLWMSGCTLLNVERDTFAHASVMRFFRSCNICWGVECNCFFRYPQRKKSCGVRSSEHGGQFFDTAISSSFGFQIPWWGTSSLQLRSFSLGITSNTAVPHCTAVFGPKANHFSYLSKRPTSDWVVLSAKLVVRRFGFSPGCTYWPSRLDFLRRAPLYVVFYEAWVNAC